MAHPSDEEPAEVAAGPIDLDLRLGLEPDPPAPDPSPAPEVALDAGPDPEPPAADVIAFIVPPPSGPAEVEPGPDPVARLGDSIAALEAQLSRRLDSLQIVFDRELRAEATREKVVDRLHAELQEYKQGLILGILRPVFVDLIRLHDDIGKALEAPEGARSDAARLLALLGGYRQEVEDILYRQGVEPFDHDADGFDPRRQRALSTVPTDDPALNKQVAARLRRGFQAGDKVIRPEMVQVYAHKPARAPADPA